MDHATSVAELAPRGRPGRVSPDDEHRSSAIWERIRRRVEDRLRAVELHAHQLLDRDLTWTERETSVTAAEELARELGRLELPSIARLARHLVSTLGRDRLDAGDAVHLAGTTEDIRTLLSSAIAQQESTTHTRGTIVAIGPATVAFDGLCWVLASRGHTVVHDAESPVELPSPPAGVLLAVDRFTSATGTLLQAIGETWPVPIVALHGSDDPGTLRALAARCTTIMPATTPADAVCAELARDESVREVSPVIYAHGHLSREALGLIRANGFRIKRARDIDELPGLVQREHAAAIFGDSAPADDVASVARVIRAVPATRRTPLIRLARLESRDQEMARRLDVLVVETMTDGVMARTAASLRSAAADRVEDEQASSAMLAWPAARVLTDRLLVAAHRTGASVVVLVIALEARLADDEVDRVLDALGHEFRRGDIVGLRGDWTVVVALQGVSRRVATNRASELLRRLDLEDGGTRASVAMFPGDGRSADELVEAADRARDVARKNHGPLVVSTAWRPVSEQAADVLVVDSDPVLGRILASLLTERGHRTELLDDGLAALERLTSPDAAAVPRLLLVDLDTTGLDGLSLVRRLRRAGVLTQTSVLLMSARSSESTLRVALDLGVGDVIDKPFSSTLLMHRVGRLLEDR